MALSDLTTNSLTGTGVFDVLMSVVSKHLEEEFTKNRITGKEYATVYLGSLTAVLEQSIAYLSIDAQKAKLEKEIELLNAQLPKITAEIALLNQKTATEAGQIGVLDKQKALYDAQTAGFGRDAEQKLAKIMVDSWSVRRTTDDGTLTPAKLTDSSINTVITKVAEGIGVIL